MMDLVVNTYPAEWIEQLTLEDGTQVTLRPIRPDDAARLQAGFLKLTPETIYLRFMKIAVQLTDREAENFANVDYQANMAFVCSIQEDGEEQLIVSARYASRPDEPGIAEVGIVVRDDYQGRGLGGIVLNRLVRYARTHGIHEFAATILTSNMRIMRFVQSSGLPYRREMIEPGVWDIRISLWESEA
jgi:acetyltransferase